MTDSKPPSRPVLHRPAKSKPADTPAQPAPSGGMRSKGYRSHGAAAALRPPAPRANVWRSDDPSALKGEGKPVLRSAGMKRHEGAAPTDGQGRPMPRQLDRPPQRRRPEDGRPERDEHPRRAWRDDPDRPPRARRRDDADSRAPQRNRQERPQERPQDRWRDADGAGRYRDRDAASAQPPRERRAPLAPAVPTDRLPADAAPVRARPAAAPSLTTGIRLNKRMAELGLCSRREADEWIAQGWVLVNGEAAETGQRVRIEDEIRVQKAARGQQEQRVTILIHKPVGYVSGQPEDGYQSAASLIRAASRWQDCQVRQRFQPQQLRGLAPAGRLDIDSTGLLVLTQDGRVARQLIGEDSTTDKEYLVRVEYQSPRGIVSQDVQSVFPADQLALLRHGLSLDGVPLQPAQVDWQNLEQLRFVLVEGKKRQIRRMCEAVGLKVVGLKRVRIGQVVLGKLPVGQWRYLGPHEQF